MIYSSVTSAKDTTLIPLFTDGKSMYSRYSPQKEAEKYACITEKNKAFFLVTGLGNGLHLRTLLKKYPNSYFFVVENSLEDYEWLKNHFDLEDIIYHPHIHITFLDYFIPKLKQTYIPQLHGDFVYAPLRSWLDQIQKNDYNFSKKLEEYISELSSDMATQAHFGKQWFGNFFINLACIFDKQTTIKTTASKVIITAAGPSLEQFLPQIQAKKQTSDYFLIATDTSVPVLRKWGIHPDVAVCIDSQIHSKNHFFIDSSSKEHLKNTIFAFDLCVSPSVVATVRVKGSEIFFFRNNNPLSTLFSRFITQNADQEIPLLNTGGGTVTSAAFDLAHHLGFTDIEVFGADFAYIDGKPYCKGTYFEDLFSVSCDRISPLDKKYTDLLYRLPTTRLQNQSVTTDILQNYKKSFYEYVQSHTDIMCQVQGMTIQNKNTTYKPSKQTLTEYKCLTSKITKKHAQNFILFYTKELNRLSSLTDTFFDENITSIKDLLTISEIIPSLLPLFSWDIKKNNTEKSFLRIIKLAYSYMIRYTDIL